jgi:hypothetical protein
MNKSYIFFVQNFVFFFLRDIANQTPECYIGIKFQGIHGPSTAQQGCRTNVPGKRRLLVRKNPVFGQ